MNQPHETMKRLLLITAMLLVSWSIKAQMVLEFNTALSAGTTVTLPLQGTVNVTVAWGDGITETFTVRGEKSHTYAVGGTYTVSITGNLSRFGNGPWTYPNASKLVKIKSFGNLGLTGLDGACYGASNLIEVPNQIPTTVKYLGAMFAYASIFNQDISSWM